MRAIAPVVFWLVDDEHLTPAAVDVSCAAPPYEVVEHLLRALGAGPDDPARAAGRATAVPPSTPLTLVEVADGVATVAMDPTTPITADRLPLAVGQLALSVTSAPGVDRVLVSIAGEAVQVPLPGGALTARPVSADDYAELVPDRYRDRGKPGGMTAGIGCR